MEDKFIMKKISKLILVTVLVLSMLLTGCGNKEVEKKAEAQTSESKSETIEPVTIRLGVGTSRTPHFTALVGNAEGIFEKYGLNVEIVEFTSGIETINGIELGQVDFGYVADFGGLNRLGNAKDANLRFIARLESSATMRFYVNSDNISLKVPREEYERLKQKGVI